MPLTIKEIECRLRKLENDLAEEEILASAPTMAYLRVASSVAEAETVTIGSTIFEVDTDDTVAGTNIPVDLSASAATKATSTLTSSGVNVTVGDTATIGATVYTFKDTMTTAYDVKRGADAATTLANFKAAINGTGTAGTEYFAGTVAHTSVTAGTITATTLVITARVAGVAGNSIATTETATTLGWTSTVMAGGVNATAAQFTTALVLAINSAGIGILASRPDANSVIVADEQKRVLATTETLAGSNNAWASATLVGGTTGDSREAIVVARVPTATEVTVQVMVFPLNFTPTAANVTVRTSAGVYRVWDGAITISGQSVIVASSGSVDVAAGDIVTVTAQ